MTEEECRKAWNKHQATCHPGDSIDYMDFRSIMGLNDEEEY